MPACSFEYAGIKLLKRIRPFSETIQRPAGHIGDGVFASSVGSVHVAVDTPAPVVIIPVATDGLALRTRGYDVYGSAIKGKFAFHLDAATLRLQQGIAGHISSSRHRHLNQRGVP